MAVSGTNNILRDTDMSKRACGIDVLLRRLTLAERQRVYFDACLKHAGWIFVIFVALPGWIWAIAANLLGFVWSFGRGQAFWISAAMIVAQMLLAYHIVSKIAIRRFVRSDCKGGQVPKCLKCGYDLQGSIGRNCPECGFDTIFQSDQNSEVEQD